ncbi:MAG: hypothetical protein HY527_07205 [Betaproteobacteria bacterium]|nr:hypothetical protein [Betaproteobacteria bacterium]
MNTQPLSSTEAQRALQFSDSASCKRWIEELPLTNVQQTQRVLTAQCAALNAVELSALERLKILEALREPVAFVQTESANRYAGKPIPLEANESAVWASVIELWEELSRNYQHCLQAYRDGDLTIAPHAALITMRCLHCLGRQMAEHYRVYRQLPAALWRALNELYFFAEQHGFARIRVQDSFAQQEPDSSCAETYLQALLVHLANPYALSMRQLAFVQSWTEKWATLVGLAPQPLPTSSTPSMAVDLGGAAGVVFESEVAPQPNLRYLDLEPLSKTLRQTITLLKQGQTPAQLGLGETARQPGCENLLMLLYVQWCRAGTGRGEERQQTEERVSVCFGISAAHFQVSGRREFRQPTELTSREKRDLDTFGYVVHAERQAGDRSAEGLEVWHILNHSASGFMCILRDPGSKSRIAHNQLVAVQRRGTRNFQLGMVQWLRLEEDQELCLGVRVFPGVPQAVAVRPSNFNPNTNVYERALLLPEVPAAATPATLILPPGWFQSGRFVEAQSDSKQVAKLLNLLEMGSDFDRCTITLI